MALTEQTIIDRLEILADGTIQVRESNQILRDGEVISSTFHRRVVSASDQMDQAIVDRIATINLQLVSDNEALTTQVATLKSDNLALEAQVAELQAQLPVVD